MELSNVNVFEEGKQPTMTLYTILLIRWPARVSEQAFFPLSGMLDELLFLPSLSKLTDMLFSCLAVIK